MSAWRMDDRTREKYAQAEQLGLLKELERVGWAGLSAKDTGRIGGRMHKGKKAN